MSEPNEDIIKVFEELYSKYTPNDIGIALREYRLREGFWSPELVKPKVTRSRATKPTPDL
jgi:hypothetical protein